jgi:Tol biopolymer transport system component
LVVPIQSAGGATANGKIAFITTRDSGEIYTIDADGTDETRLTRRDPNGFAPAWSPDGSTISFSGSSDRFMNLWVMSRDGDDARPLGDFRSDFGPAHDSDWSPNGGRLVFSSYYTIYVVRANGTDVRRLTSFSYDSWDPAWSPAGGAIAFTRNARIYLMRPDGSRKRSLGVGDEADWSPTGRRIVFSVDRPNGKGDLYIMDADGSNRRQLTNTRADDSRPAWSPGGGKIAFQRENSVWLMDRDGTNRQRLARNAAAPTWSPDGSLLAFARRGAIYVMRRDGNGVTRILTPEFDRDVAPSPDGAKIAFTSERPFSQSGVYVADADGTNEVFVHTGSSPAWSPDSAQLVLADSDGLYVVDADGTDPTKLPAPELGGSALRFVTDPGWRPGAGAVTFVASETGECPEVYTMELDGTPVTQVTAADCAPQVGGYDWAADGGSIVLAGSTCDADFNCTYQIFIATPPGGAPSALTHPDPDAQDVEPAIAPDGTKIAFTRFDLQGLGEWDVWVMDADGTDEMKVTTTGDNDAPAWQALP